MSRKKHKPGSSGWVQVVAGAIVVLAATVGAGHSNLTSPRPPTVCAQLRLLPVALVAHRVF